MRHFFRAALCGLGMIAMLGGAAQAADLPKLESPAIITSLGQSPDAKTLSVLAGRAKVAADYKPLATPAEIAAVKTAFVTVGTSLKGFGSAGVNLDTEKARCKEFVKAAHDSGTYLVLVHIGGEGRRDAMTNQLLDEFAPSADAFIVYEAGNGDGYFNKAAGDKPLVLVPKAVQVSNVLGSAMN
ncbi:MAG: hypothetical protein J5855_01220 [Mailhella sp.]|nr:hypothetical protein [Mailhella sp.]